MTRWMKQLELWPKRFIAPGCVLIVTVVGLLDYATGYETFFFIFYLLAVILGAWFVGIPFGVLMSALSVTAWLSSNIAAGEHYSSYFVPEWNALIMFMFYLVVVWLLAKLQNFNRELEGRVQRRTDSLAKEIRERMRLQKELLETSERERQRIGHELHDSLCQHLTGTALAGHLTGQKLAEKSLPEAAEISRLVSLIEDAIELTRKLSRSLSPVELQPDRLLDNFHELAANASKEFNVACRFDCQQPAPQLDNNTATHLYRIALESITNAVHHGKASKINVRLEVTEDEIILTISDDGSGLPENFQKSRGAGLRLLAYRADLIGATFNIGDAVPHGTLVKCVLLNPVAVQENHVTKN